MKIDGEFKWNKSINRILAERNIETGGKVQATIDAAVIRECEPYVPYDTGTLARSPNTASDIGSGKIVYPGPYAHYMYIGEVYGPNIPIKQGGEIVGFFSPPGQIKEPTGRQMEYSKEHSALSGPQWLERMKADHTDDILAEACAVAGARPIK